MDGSQERRRKRALPGGGEEERYAEAAEDGEEGAESSSFETGEGSPPETTSDAEGDGEHVQGGEGPVGGGGGPYPVGFRFHPTDEELVKHYLLPFVQDKPLPFHIPSIDVCNTEPSKLPRDLAYSVNGEFYGFARRERCSKKGSRPRRTVSTTAGKGGLGTWHANGNTESVMVDGRVTAKKRLLSFQNGGPENANWVMHEYSIQDGSKFQEVAVCRIRHRKPDKEERLPSPPSAGAKRLRAGESTREVVGESSGSSSSGSSGSSGRVTTPPGRCEAAVPLAFPVPRAEPTTVDPAPASPPGVGHHGCQASLQPPNPVVGAESHPAPQQGAEAAGGGQPGTVLPSLGSDGMGSSTHLQESEEAIGYTLSLSILEQRCRQAKLMAQAGTKPEYHPAPQQGAEAAGGGQPGTVLPSLGSDGRGSSTHLPESEEAIGLRAYTLALFPLVPGVHASALNLGAEMRSTTHLPESEEAIGFRAYTLALFPLVPGVHASALNLGAEMPAGETYGSQAGTTPEDREVPPDKI